MPAHPIDAVLTGTVVFDDLQLRDAYLLNLQTAITQSVINAGGYHVSPDRKYMSYRNFVARESGDISDDSLVIIDGEGQLVKELAWDPDWLALVGWLDNQQLVLQRSAPPGPLPVNLESLNPFTNQRQLLPTDFSELVPSSVATTPSWEGWFGIVYDSRLSRAIYPRFAGPDNSYLTYGLWDLTNQRLVASLEGALYVPASDNDLFPMPIWSSDSTKFVIYGIIPDPSGVSLALFELFQVDRDGQLEQLTNLTSFAGIQEDSQSWSPDGRYLAMFLVAWQSDAQEARLAILDTNTLQITDYCFPIRFGNGFFPVRPVWSPDGRQVLVADSSGIDHPRVILVDFNGNWAAQLAQDVEPVGWMVIAP